LVADEDVDATDRDDGAVERGFFSKNVAVVEDAPNGGIVIDAYEGISRPGSRSRRLCPRWVPTIIV
jgi:hypothetical protein